MANWQARISVGVNFSLTLPLEIIRSWLPCLNTRIMTFVCFRTGTFFSWFRRCGALEKIAARNRFHLVDCCTGCHHASASFTMAGIMLLVLGVLFFLVGCAYATVMLPAWTAQRRTLQRWLQGQGLWIVSYCLQGMPQFMTEPCLFFFNSAASWHCMLHFCCDAALLWLQGSRFLTHCMWLHQLNVVIWFVSALPSKKMSKYWSFFKLSHTKKTMKVDLCLQSCPVCLLSIGVYFDSLSAFFTLVFGQGHGKDARLKR